MIGYYVHHQGFGHLARALSIGRQLRRPVTLLSSRAVPQSNPFMHVVALPRDDDGSDHRDPTANQTLHWAPRHDPGYGARMAAIAQWVADAKPEVFVVDVSLEVAVFVRLLGIPVVVVALPGDRSDTPHQLGYRMADRILAAWPRELCRPDWLRQFDPKVAYVGGISRFEGRANPDEDGRGAGIVVLSGADGITIDENRWAGLPYTRLGASASDWVEDPWPQLTKAAAIVTHAGQNSIADVALAQRPTIVIPQRRPYGEQYATAAVLRRYGLAAVMPDGPRPVAIATLLKHARTLDPQRWRQWRVDGGATRAARVIESVARDARQGVR